MAGDWGLTWELVELRGFEPPDLLPAISRQHVHRSTSVQVTVPRRAHQSGQIRTGCCTFMLGRFEARPAQIDTSKPLEVLLGGPAGLCRPSLRRGCRPAETRPAATFRDEVDGKPDADRHYRDRPHGETPPRLREDGRPG